MNYLQELVNLPRNFKKSNLSWADLLLPKLSFFLKIQVSEIQDYIANHDELMNEWIEFSENKRSSEGFYISKVKSNIFEVGFFLETKKEKKIYKNKEIAVSNFIVRELQHFEKTSG